MAPIPLTGKRRSTLRLLFSTDYTRYLAPRVARTGYRMVIVITVCMVLLWVWVASALPEWVGWGIPALVYILAPILGLGFLAMTRIALEYLLVTIDMAETMHKIDHRADYLARVAEYLARPAYQQNGGEPHGEATETTVPDTEKTIRPWQHRT